MSVSSGSPVVHAFLENASHQYAEKVFFQASNGIIGPQHNRFRETNRWTDATHKKEAHLGLEGTARIHRRSFDHSGIHPTGVASIQAQECARDKPAVYTLLYHRHSFLAVLRDFTAATVGDHMECHDSCLRMCHVVCETKVRTIAGDYLVALTTAAIRLSSLSRPFA